MKFGRRGARAHKRVRLLKPMEYQMQATLRKSKEDGLVLHIPDTLAERARMREGEIVNVRLNGVELVVSKRPRYKLGDLLARHSPEKNHGEVSWGRDVGREVLA
jgi:antitoxin MazE